MALDDLILELVAQLRVLAPEERQMHIDRVISMANPDTTKKARAADRRASRAIIDNLDAEMLEMFAEWQK